MHTKTILLVDDEESILNSFSKDFAEAGYSVQTATSGEEAIALLPGNHFDLVVSDLVMPGINGMDVLQEVRQRMPDACTMILTGFGDMSSAIEALRLGVDDYLVKPCDIEELLLRARRCLEKREALRKVKVYETILPVCIFCKKIRDDSGTKPGRGEWRPMEDYLDQKSNADIVHNCCPECYKQHKHEWEKY